MCMKNANSEQIRAQAILKTMSRSDTALESEDLIFQVERKDLNEQQGRSLLSILYLPKTDFKYIRYVNEQVIDQL